MMDWVFRVRMNEISEDGHNLDTRCTDNQHMQSNSFYSNRTLLVSNVEIGRTL